MDTVLFQKILTHLAYPTGFIGLMLTLAIISNFLYLQGLAKKCLYLAAIVFIVSSNSYVAEFLVKSLEDRYPQFSIEATPKANAIIVLGGSLAPPAQPRKFAQYTNRSNRFWLAGELYKAGKAKHIIVTGGNVFTQNGLAPEATYIRDRLVESGIPKEVIIMESSSRTTRENASETAKILTKLQADTALLVTSSVHMPRSIQLFSALELNIIPTPSDKIVAQLRTPNALKIIPSSRAIDLTTQALHEYYGIISETITRWIKRIF